MDRELATHIEDLPHDYLASPNPGDRCQVCGSGRRAALHQVASARERAAATGNPNTLLQRELGS